MHGYCILRIIQFCMSRSSRYCDPIHKYKEKHICDSKNTQLFEAKVHVYQEANGASHSLLHVFFQPVFEGDDFSVPRVEFLMTGLVIAPADQSYQLPSVLRRPLSWQKSSGNTARL